MLHAAKDSARNCTALYLNTQPGVPVPHGDSCRDGDEGDSVLEARTIVNRLGMDGHEKEAEGNDDGRH